MEIGEYIKYLRERAGLNQADLAKIIGVSDKTVSTWEIGKKIPRMGAIEKLAAYFGVRKSDIIDGRIEATEKPPKVTEADLRFALFNGDEEITDAQWEEVKRFAAYVKARDSKQ